MNGLWSYGAKFLLYLMGNEHNNVMIDYLQSQTRCFCIHKIQSPGEYILCALWYVCHGDILHDYYLLCPVYNLYWFLLEKICNVNILRNEAQLQHVLAQDSYRIISFSQFTELSTFSYQHSFAKLQIKLIITYWSYYLRSCRIIKNIQCPTALSQNLDLQIDQAVADIYQQENSHIAYIPSAYKNLLAHGRLYYYYDKIQKYLSASCRTVINYWHFVPLFVCFLIICTTYSSMPVLATSLLIMVIMNYRAQKYCHQHAIVDAADNFIYIWLGILSTYAWHRQAYVTYILAIIYCYYRCKKRNLPVNEYFIPELFALVEKTTYLQIYNHVYYGLDNLLFLCLNLFIL